MRRLTLALVALALGATSRGPATAAEVRVLASAAIRPALDELAPRFEARSGHTLVIRYATAASAKTRIEAGEAFDVAILTPAPTDDLIRSGRLAPEPRAGVGATAASLAYRTSAPRPDIGTDEAFRATVLGAAAISLSDPALGGASSSLFMAAVKRLGLEEAIRGKLVFTPGGEGAVPVGAGMAQVGVALGSEIAGVPGVSGVPLFPESKAGTTRLVATLPSKPSEPEGPRAFLAFLLSPEAVAVRRSMGFTAE